MSAKSLESNYNLGFELLEAGRFAESLVCFTIALNLSDDSCRHEILHFMGNANKHLGNYHEAVLLIRQALGLFPEFPAAYADLGDCLFEQGNFHAAQIAYESGIEHCLPGEEVLGQCEIGLARLGSDLV